MNYIKLCFSGVLQYYCSTDATTIKSTYNSSRVPTKTSVIGLIASAFGYERGSSKSADLFNSLDVKYEILNAPTVMWDFQTVKPLKSQQNYMNKQSSTGKFITYNNKPADRNIIKNIEYLQDGEFNVYVGGSDELLKSIYEAIKNPQYALFFGKRSCVPNKPIVTSFELIDEGELTNVLDCA